MPTPRMRATPAHSSLETLIAKSAPTAFALVHAEIAAVPATALITINVDIPRSARRGLVVAERLAPLLPVLAKLHGLDLHAVGNLHTYALALLHTHALVTSAEAEISAFSRLVTEATTLRANLRSTAEMLAHFGMVSGERVAAIRRARGHCALAEDLLTLGLMLTEVWDRVVHKVAVTQADVDRAIDLSASLQQELGLRESNPDPLVGPSGRRFVRAQAYTLFVRAYGQCRRGVTYLRWDEGDALQIVPPLHRGSRPASRPRRDDTANAPSEREVELGSEPEPMSAPVASASTLAVV